MPMFEFTSPDGETFTGEGASAEDAFRVAAERTRRSATRGAAAPEYEPLEATQAVKRGEYGPLVEQAGASVGELGRAMFPMAGLLAEAVSPASAGGMFESEPDPKKRRALEKQYNEAGPKGKREIVAAFNAEQSQIESERRRVQEEERKTGQTQKSRENWFAQNQEAIGVLSPEWQQRIQAAPTLADAQDKFDQGMQELQRTTMTWAERNPEAMQKLQEISALASFGFPFQKMVRASRDIGQATKEARGAFKAANEPRAGKKAESDLQLKSNILDETVRANEGLRGVPWGTAVLSPIVPTVATQIPNALDVASLPYGSPGSAKALETLNPLTERGQQAYLRSLGEGIGATVGGVAVGEGITHSRLPSARGIAKTIRQREV